MSKKTKLTEEQAAKIADQQDNPRIPMTEDEEYRNAGISKEEIYGQKEKQELHESYKQSLANKKEREVNLMSMDEVRQRTEEAAKSLGLKEIEPSKKPFGRGGFGQGKPDDAMYLKDLQRNRILKKLDLIKDKLGDMKQIIVLLEEQLNKLK